MGGLASSRMGLVNDQLLTRKESVVSHFRVQHSYWERKHGTRVRVAGKPAKTWTEYSFNCCTNLHTGLFCFEGFHDTVSSRHYSLSMTDECWNVFGSTQLWPNRGSARTLTWKEGLRKTSNENVITVVYDLSKIWKTHLQCNKCRELTIHQPSVLVEINVTVLNGMSGGVAP